MALGQWRTIIWKMTALAIMLAGTWTVFLPDRGFACSCAAPLPVEEAADLAYAVFAGRVTDVQDATSPQGYSIRVASFEADKVYKGEASSIMTVRTGGGGGDCGFYFETGQSYLVYAYSASADGSGDDLATGICTRTKHLDHAGEDLAILGPGTEPQQQSLIRYIAEGEQPGSGKAIRYAAGTAAAVVAASLAIWLIVRARRNGTPS